LTDTDRRVQAAGTAMADGPAVVLTTENWLEAMVLLLPPSGVYEVGTTCGGRGEGLLLRAQTQEQAAAWGTMGCGGCPSVG
jgi:hypothetical protein